VVLAYVLRVWARAGVTWTARSVFTSQATLGHSGKKKAVEAYKHRHSIADMKVLESKAGLVTKFTTVCTGGKMVVWDLNTLDVDMARLKL